MRKASIERTWGECLRNGRKVEDWSWEVTFYEGEFIEMNDYIDRHYYNNEQIAVDRAQMFEDGQYTTSEYGGVDFPEQQM